MSARYPGDTQDALSINDSPMPHWWNSPDIGVNAFGGAVADEGANTIHLRVHLGAGKTFSDSQAEIEVFVGNPSLVMTPAAGTINLGTVLVAKTDLVASGSVETELPWTVTVDPGNPGGIDQPGHRCLIARVYPFTSGKPTDFQVPTDQHEAQRNLCIVECADAGAGGGGAGGGMIGAPGGEIRLGPGDDGLWGFMIDTTTPLEAGELVTVRATRPLTLHKATLKEVMPILERAGFRGFAAEPPRFSLELAEGGEPGAKRGAMTTQVSALDRLVTRLPGLVREPLLKLPLFGRKTPRFELDVKLDPKRMARLGLKADLRKTRRGQAHVFHVEQIGSKQQVQGGLTLVLLKVD